LVLAVGLVAGGYYYSYLAGCAWDGKQAYGNVELGLHYDGIAAKLFLACVGCLIVAALANGRRAPSQAIAFVVVRLFVQFHSSDRA
jgi:hypothetical protein